MQIDLDVLMQTRKGNGVPSEYTVGKTIGKGANNEVLTATNNTTNIECVYRKPLKRSDSRDRNDAIREANYTKLASDIGVAPTLYDIWFVRKSTLAQRRGLYTISLKLSNDLTYYFKNDIDFILNNIARLKKEITSCIYTLAHNGLFCYDLKPANTVCNKTPFLIKMIDFGADYTESLYDNPPGKIVSATKTFASSIFHEDIEKECKFAFYVVMLIIYSAHLYGTVRSYDLGLYISQMWSANFMVSVIVDTQRKMSPEQQQLVCFLLKHKEIRKLFEHYFDADRQTSYQKACRRAHFALKF